MNGVDSDKLQSMVRLLHFFKDFPIKSIKTVQVFVGLVLILQDRRVSENIFINDIADYLGLNPKECYLSLRKLSYVRYKFE